MLSGGVSKSKGSRDANKGLLGSAGVSGPNTGDAKGVSSEKCDGECGTIVK